MCLTVSFCFVLQEMDKKKGDKKGQKKKVKNKASQRKTNKKSVMPHGANDLTTKIFSTMEKHKEVSYLTYVLLFVGKHRVSSNRGQLGFPCLMQS